MERLCIRLPPPSCGGGIAVFRRIKTLDVLHRYVGLCICLRPAASLSSPLSLFFDLEHPPKAELSTVLRLGVRAGVTKGQQ
jgi:hypothetical protein